MRGSSVADDPARATASASARLREEWGITEHDMQSLVNAGGVEMVERQWRSGRRPANARKWWTGEIARISNERGVDVAELPITPTDVTGSSR